MAKRHLEQYDKNGNRLDIYLNDDEVMTGGKTLGDKLAEMQDDIDHAGQGDGTVTGVKVGNTPYSPDSNGVVDLSTPFAGKVDKEIGKSLMTDAERTKLQNLPTADQLIQQLGQKANDNAVVKSISVNGGTPQTPQNGNVNIQVQTGSTISPADTAPQMDGNTASVGSSAKYAREDHVHPHDTSKLSKSDVSVETQGDGTVDINVGSGANKDTYTINLNHTHEGMAKLVKCTEATLPQTLADDTIYVQVDNLTTPTEIESLYLFGLEFTGGGAAPGVPTLDYPKVTELSLDGDGDTDATNTIKVKAKNITGAINVAISGTGFSITAKDGVALSTPITSANGPLVISNADALLGVMLTIAYNGADDAEGSLVISSAAATAEFTAKSVDLIADITRALPVGWHANKAWTASGEIMSAPNDLEGFCTTEFFALAHDNSRKFGWICKAGYTCDHDGITGDIPRGLMVLKNELTDTNSNAAYRQKTDPIAYSDTDGPYIYNFISATFKMSELPNCYIYDTIAGRYLWAGSNVDTSVAPNV